MGLLEKRNLLLELVEKRIELKKHEEALKKEIQSECPHGALLEVGYRGYSWGGCEPPRRMCLVCGLEEDGWGTGYGALRDDQKVMKTISGNNRDEFYQYRKLKSVDELADIITAKTMANLLASK